MSRPGVRAARCELKHRGRRVQEFAAGQMSRVNTDADRRDRRDRSLDVLNWLDSHQDADWAEMARKAAEQDLRLLNRPPILPAALRQRHNPDWGDLVPRPLFLDLDRHLAELGERPWVPIRPPEERDRPPQKERRGPVDCRCVACRGTGVVGEGLCPLCWLFAPPSASAPGPARPVRLSNDEMAHRQELAFGEDYHEVPSAETCQALFRQGDEVEHRQLGTGLVMEVTAGAVVVEFYRQRPLPDGSIAPVVRSFAAAAAPECLDITQAQLQGWGPAVAGLLGWMVGLVAVAPAAETPDAGDDDLAERPVLATLWTVPCRPYQVGAPVKHPLYGAGQVRRRRSIQPGGPLHSVVVHFPAMTTLVALAAA